MSYGFVGTFSPISALALHPRPDGASIVMPTHWESTAEPIPGYRLVERLGRGGFGEVWKAEAPGGLSKAIKFVHGEIADGNAKHAHQELKALERVRGIRHPFILTMERFDIIDGQLMIVMEIADCSLEQRLRECQNQGLIGIPRNELLGYMTEASEALDVMSHEHDLQHLDIKPQNIFLIAGHVKVADFGLVKDLEGCTASVTGGVTPVYAPPETFDGWVSRSSDQYSLGIVYQEMLTGTRPFPGPSARQYMMQHLTADPDLSPLPACDRAIVRKAMSKDPKERYPSCREFVDALREAGKTTYSTTTLAGTDTQPIAAVSEAGISTRLVHEDKTGECKTSIRSAPTLDRAGVRASASGVTRPTLVIGLGETGFNAVGAVREKLRARHGDSSSWPAVRLLSIDVESALARLDQKVLGADVLDQMLLCRIRKPNQLFQEWDGLKHLSRWLNPNMLFQITSNGSTNGQRALGRLAFFENYRRIFARLRTEIDALLDPARIQSSVSGCGRTLRTEEPQVVVIASMGGGVGSGMFLDLCYAIRQVLLESGVSSPDIDGYLIAAHRASKPQSELRRINSFALAQDVLNLTQPDAKYSVDYEGAGQIHNFTGPPCKAIYYLDADGAALPEPKEPAIQEVLADWVWHSLASTVGKQLERSEREEHWSKHRSLGIFSLSYPVRKMLSVAAARLCDELVGTWLESMPRREGDYASDHASRMIAAAGFDPNDIARSLLDAANVRLEQPIHVLAAEAIAEIEERLSASPPKERTDLYRDAIVALKEMFGPDPDEDDGSLVEMPIFEAALAGATNDLANEMLDPLIQSLSMSLDRPGNRFERSRRTWEGFSTYLLQKLDQTLEAARAETQKVCRRARMLRERITSGSTMGIDSAARRVELLDRYAQDKIDCRLREQVVQVYLVLRGRLSDWSRDFVRIRQRVEQLRAVMAAEGAKKLTALGGLASQTVFPGGYLTVEEAADHLFQQVRGVARQDLDAWIQSSMIAPIGGLWELCGKDEEFQKHLPTMFISAAMNWLQEGLATTDVAQAIIDRHGGNVDSLGRELGSFFEWALPSAPYRAPSGPIDVAPAQECLVLAVPDSPAGKQLGEMFRRGLTGIVPQIVDAGDECVVSRVQAHESLARILPKWVLDSKPLYDAACQTRLSPEIFPDDHD